MEWMRYIECVIFALCSLKLVECWYVLHDVEREIGEARNQGNREVESREVGKQGSGKAGKWGSWIAGKWRRRAKRKWGSRKVGKQGNGGIGPHGSG